MNVPASVIAVSASPEHRFSKDVRPAIRLIAGIGVEGDAHAGVTVKHRSRVAADPTQPNLRQVHLVQRETLERLAAAGFRVEAGTIGENVTTAGIDLFALPVGTLLALGDAAIVEITGLRNPCRQLDDHQHGLTAAVLGRDGDGKLLLRVGIMGIVRAGGEVRQGDAIGVTLPPEPHRPLARV